MGGVVFFKLSEVFNKLRPKGVNTAPLLFYAGDGKLFGAMTCARPLDVAVGNKDLKEAEALLDKGANPNLVAHGAGPAIKEAARTGSIDMVKLLHSRGADVNGRDSAGGTALHAAISDCYQFNMKEKIEILEFLLAQGAKTDVKNSCDMTPLEWARQLWVPEAERVIAKHLGFDTCEELAPGRQDDGTYVFPVSADEPSSAQAKVKGLRDIYSVQNFETKTVATFILTSKAEHLAERAFGLGKCECLVRDAATKETVTEMNFGGNYELLLVPEAVLKQRAQAAADEKAAFDGALKAGLPTGGKVKGMKPISFKKPAA